MGLFDKIDHRTKVMTRMAQTLDVDFSEVIAQAPEAVREYRQAVLRCAYEWRRQGDQTPPEVLDLAGTELAPAIEVEKLGDHYEERLEEAGFFFPATKAEGMKLNLRNLWSRMPLTRADVQTLHGVLRQIVRKAGK